MTLIEEMEMYAHEHDVPIMQKEGIDFMCSFLKEHNLKHVLEIGSAIGNPYGNAGYGYTDHHD